MSQAKPSWASLLQQQQQQPPRSEPPGGDASNNRISAAADPPAKKVNANVNVNHNSSAAASAEVKSPAAREATTTPPRGRVAMISGHIDLSPEEFAKGYHAQLDAALARGDTFIMGDAKGADELALAYLLAKDPATAAVIAGRITVYASRPANVAKLKQMGIKVILDADNGPAATTSSPPHVGRGRGQGQQSRGGGRNRGRQHHLRRDATMTENSDYDILCVRTEAESRALYGDKYRARVSATEMNRQRRAGVLARHGASN
ncbi:hypothetical protein PG996_006433 [Apiospora saccharicola]|uniref:Uncharacterized protein n=1 Tax=Apiospora saccharicola TaxID=335842 RepID=A0ABR1VSF8_9PEZI